MGSYGAFAPSGAGGGGRAGVTGGGATRLPPFRRGQPLFALALILGIWVAARASVLSLELETGVVLPGARIAASSAGARPGGGRASSAGPERVAATPAYFPRSGATLRSPPGKARPVPERAVRGAPGRASLAPWLPPAGSGPGEDFAVTTAVGDQPEPGRAPDRAPIGVPAAPVPPVPRPPGPPPRSRWQADAWLLLRARASETALATGAASYGGSQFGAVLRYALAPDRALRPQLYLRGAGALGGARDRQAAAGLALHPLRRLPLALVAEARVQQGTVATQVRPAAGLVAGLPPARLPLGLLAEGFGQAGVVGGPGGTGYFDVQATAERRLLRFGPDRGATDGIQAGLGVWAGGQRDAARLDIGPRIALRFHSGGTGARLALDWRIRAAGGAEPGSGAVLTLAAGF